MEKMSNAYRIDSITEAHKLLHLPKPLHPLISLVDTTAITIDLRNMPIPHVLPFYKISYRAKLSGKVRYGQGYYDFDEGGLLFAGPNQVIGVYNYLSFHLLIIRRTNPVITVLFLMKL